MKKANKILVIFNNFLFIPLILGLSCYYLYILCNKCLVKVGFPGLLISIIIIDAILLILLSIFGKINISYIFLLILCFIVFLINQIKIFYMEEPLFFSDFNFFNKVSNLVNIIGNDYRNIIFDCINYSVIFIIIIILFFLYQSYFKIELKSIKKRISLGLVGTFILFMLFFPFSWSKRVYKDLFFYIDNYTDYGSYTDYISLYSYYGLIGGMYYQLLESRLDIPNNYSSEELEKILLDVGESKSDNNIGKPNIIVVLSESFFDVNLLKNDIKFDKEITYNFNELKNNSDFVNIISPSYGGMTANVTFELLTGGNMSYFGRGYIPFMQLYNDNSKYDSVVRELVNNGYNTSIYMGNDSYNSKEVLLNMGFNYYNEIEKTKDNVKGQYVSDDYIADLIITSLEKDRDKKFIMVETMQSHMGYTLDKYDNYDIEVVDSDLTKEKVDVLLSYSQGIYDADKMLLKVYDYIQSIEEDTILIFFGDHLPYLKTSYGKNIIEDLSYFNTSDELINLYRLYNTQALILSNYDLDLKIENYLGFDLLLVSLINNMDIDISNYYKWLYSTKGILPSYNNYVAVDVNGNIYDVNKLPTKMKDALDLRNKMMYKKYFNN